jgi:hypothetical protein
VTQPAGEEPRAWDGRRREGSAETKKCLSPAKMSGREKAYR